MTDQTPPADRSPATGEASSGLFRSVDVATFCGAVLHRLRAAEVPVGPTAGNRLAEAMQHCPPRDPATLYWLAKTTLLDDRRHFETFDRIFDALFGGVGLPIAPWERELGRAQVRTEGSTVRHSAPTDGFAAMNARIVRDRPEIVDDGSDADDRPDDDDATLAELLPAPLSELADSPFDQLSDAQLAEIGRWLEAAVSRRPLRRSRRVEPSTRGQVDLRRTLRTARSSGEILTIARKRQRHEPRPVVMVADVSGSMESYSRIYLHLMRALVVQPLARAEVFTFATTLRRVTAPLRDNDPQVAIDRLADEVTDRFGGTRIAASLRSLTTSPRWSHSVRGAIVVIASDGWDTDPAPELDRSMARLARLSARIIWINPRVAAASYEPAVAGMEAALPHVDRFLSGHSLRAMAEVIAAIADPVDRSRRGGGGATAGYAASSR